MSASGTLTETATYLRGRGVNLQFVVQGKGSTGFGLKRIGNTTAITTRVRVTRKIEGSVTGSLTRGVPDPTGELAPICQGLSVPDLSTKGCPETHSYQADWGFERNPEPGGDLLTAPGRHFRPALGRQIGSNAEPWTRKLRIHHPHPGLPRAESRVPTHSRCEPGCGSLRQDPRPPTRLPGPDDIRNGQRQGTATRHSAADRLRARLGLDEHPPAFHPSTLRVPVDARRAQVKRTGLAARPPRSTIGRGCTTAVPLSPESAARTSQPAAREIGARRAVPEWPVSWLALSN